MSCPPIQLVSSVITTRFPSDVAAIAAAQPPTPPPTMRMSVRFSAKDALLLPASRHQAMPHLRV